MSKDENQGIYDMTVPAPMLFPALLQPKAYQNKGEPKYSGTFVFPADHADLPGLKAKMIAAAKAEWPGVDLKEVGFPLSSGTTYAAERKAKGKDGAFFEGKAIVKSRSKYAPMASWVENGKLHEVPCDELGPAASKFFSGAECLATFNFVAMTVDKKKYVAAYLNKVFSTGKGTRVGGGRSAAEAFKGYIGSATKEDPTQGTVADEDVFK